MFTLWAVNQVHNVLPRKGAYMSYIAHSGASLTWGSLEDIIFRNH